MTRQTVCVGSLFFLVVQSFFFITQPTSLFHFDIHMKKGIYCYARIVHYSRLCFVPGTLLCHEQCDRLRRRKLNLSLFFPFPPLSPLLVLSLCMWRLSLSLAKHLLCWAHFLKCELNYRFLISSKLEASRPLVNSMDILSQMKK